MPLLVTGGNASADGKVEAKAHGMARALREDFRTEVKWVEDRAATTADNASFSAAMLRRDGVQRILLVTDAMHMARASDAFRRSGLEVVEAPTMFFSRGTLRWLDFLPSAAALQRTITQATSGWAWPGTRSAGG